jgi:hypothetical protein
VEGTDLICLESAYDRVEESAVVEEDEVLCSPVVRVDKLQLLVSIYRLKDLGMVTYIRSNSRSLHLVE